MHKFKWMLLANAMLFYQVADPAAGGGGGAPPAGGSPPAGSPPAGTPPAGGGDAAAAAAAAAALAAGGTPPAGGEPPKLGPDGKPLPAAPVALTAADFEGIELEHGVAIDKDVLDAFLPVAKELGLSKEQGVALAKFQAKANEINANRFADTVAGWAAEAQKDTELSQGGKWAENLTIAKKGLDAMGATPELKQLLVDTGIGNHPEMIRLFYRLGKQLGESGAAPAGGGGGSPSAADVLYGGNKT